MMAAMFVSGGIDQIKRPEAQAAKAEKVAEPLAQALHLPEDPVKLVRINGAVQVGAASMLALGKLPRVSAAALAASLVPTTLAGHPFWEESEPGRRKTQRIAFLKNVSMLGGLVLAATDTEGRPSLGWRARRATTKVSRKVGRRSQKTTAKLGHALHEVERAAETAAHRVEKVAESAAHKVERAADNGAHKLVAALPVGR
jgi:uncharacterized membrane protein YphA (DoxX/SURF4 family)